MTLIMELTNIEVKSINIVQCNGGQDHSNSARQCVYGVVAIVSIANQCLVDVEPKQHRGYWGRSHG